MCNIWLISIDRTELFDDALRFSFFLISFCLPMLITAVVYHAIRLYSIHSLLRWKMIVIGFCYLIGLVFHIVNTMYWEELFRGQKFMFNILLISTAIVSYLPCQYLYTLQRRKNNP